MKFAISNIINRSNIKNNKLNNIEVTDTPLCLLEYGHIKDSVEDFSEGVNLPMGKKHYQLLYIVHGEMEFVINGEKNIYGKNTLILFKPGEAQLYKRVFNKYTTCERFYLLFSGSDAEQIMKSYGILNTVTVFDEPFNTFEDILNRMTTGNRKPHWQKFCDLLLEELFIHIANFKSANNIDTKNKSFNALVEYMKLTCTKNFSVKQYADFIGFNEIYFNRFFKKAMGGATPHQYIIRLRMQKASYMLLYTNKSISEIAFELGFQNQHYFSRAFANFFKQTPTDYRANLSPQKEDILAEYNETFGK